MDPVTDGDSPKDATDEDSPKAVADEKAPSTLQCSGGQKAMYGAHAGCEEGTCEYPWPLCMSKTMGWGCVCEKGKLFDSTRSMCVPAETESCAAQQMIRLPPVAAPETCEECKRRQAKGENIACGSLCSEEEKAPS